MEIPIIERGYRENIRLFRNLILIILGICILFLGCSVAFKFAESIQYEVVFLISIVLLFSFILTVPLLIKERIGYLILDESGTIHIKSGTDDLLLEVVTIVLNADQGELQGAMKDITQVGGILNYGNYLECSALGDGQTGELILNKKTKRYLVLWHSHLLRERFESRPFIYESPLKIVHGIIGIMQAF
ncbi:hypothetical protein KK062_05150 [Fulvivirgaceae bacterium PWU5]|uniref:Uncharacterized protein n=1 Tax=Dawidia cretensis TaxID=2782350 RepID=A0AAP2DUE4_9BACT|nr:hypothetical protein [Dawidia cretensis]MBT1707596.1 hypothetical protein [Dawidia cretensis]